MSKPVILSCFAQHPNQRELKFLEDEFSAMRDAWRQDKENRKKSYYEVDYLDYPATKIQDIPKYISKFQDSIVLFHYGGHAGSQKLFLKNGIGHGVGLAGLLGGIETLKLVFLNGCATYDQVALLFDKGVKAVLATKYAIGDEKAQAFAATFYNELAKNGVTIQRAYNHAVGALGLEDGVARNAHTVWNRGLDLEQEEGLNVWELFVNPGDESLLNDPSWWQIRSGLSSNSETGTKEFSPTPKHQLGEQLAAASERYYKVLTGLNGPYHHLHISEAILAGMIPDELASKPSHPSLSVTVKDTEGQEFSLGASLSAGWGQGKPHILLLGDGGMGKTVSLINLWETLLEKKRQDARQPVPLFISLKEYNTVPEGERHNFITSRVAWHYLGVRKDRGEATNALWDYMKDKPEQARPRLVLLLDGFNEITLDASLRSPLLLELQEINQKAGAVQMVLSSRHEMNFNWATGFQTMALQPLDSRKVESYLREYRVAIPGDSRLRLVLQNPMMLTLYANSSEIVERHKSSPQFEFKPFTTTQGELLWNYLEAQTLRLSELLGIESPDFHYHKFIIRHFLPYIGFEMETEGQFEVDERRLEQLVTDACKYFYKKEFIQAYPEYRAYLKGFNLQELDFMEEGERFERFRQLICSNLHLMRQKQKSYEFIHQNFRDYFAAVHILNELYRDVQNDTLPQILKHRALSLYIRRFMGQITGEAYQSEEPIPSPTKLMKALDAFRGVFESDALGYSVWNIINVWKESRSHLGGADFSHLNLLKTGFQDVSCYKRKGVNYQSACFDHSLVSEKEILLQGHSDYVYSVAYHPDGRSFISGSSDHTVKAWDLATGECLATFQGHGGMVNSVAFHPDGRSFISGSWDCTVKGWDWATGECLATVQGHKREVNSVAFHPDGRSFISGSEDKTVKAWDWATGECLAIFLGHSDFVTSVAFHPDGRSFVSGSEDKTVKAWDWATGECLATFQDHSSVVTSVAFHPDGCSFISGSWDKTVKAWDPATGECLATFQDHSDYVRCVAFHPDGRSFISGSSDYTLKSWDLATGKCLITMVNQPGMQLFGCSFMSLHPQSNISEKTKIIMRQYGMLFEENDKKLWQEAVQRVFGE